MVEPAPPRRIQFSLMQFIVVALVASIVLGMVIFWAPAFLRPGHDHRGYYTKSMMGNLKVAFAQYQAIYGAYPTCPYLESELFPAMNSSGISRQSKSVVKFLIDIGYLDSSRHMEFKGEGRLCDRWGNPFAIRRLAYKDGNTWQERVYIWSFGEDGINEVNATPNYVTQGPPDYDNAEIERLESSPDSDDICSWK